MTSIPRIDIDPDGVIVEVVDIAGDQRDLWAWGLVIPSDGDDIAALLLTDSHEPPTADQRAALGKALFDPSGEATVLAEKITADMAAELRSLRKLVEQLDTTLVERTTERDDARAHATRAWDEIERLHTEVEQRRTDSVTVVADAHARLAELTEQRDEAREQNVILGRRLAGQVGEQLDVLGKRWKHDTETRSWRTPPLDEDERRALHAALSTVGVGPESRAGETELLAALRTLDDAVAARYLQQLQQLADDGRECWERHHPHLQARVAQQHRELFEANQRAYAADEAVGPIRRRRDELIDELARAKTENGLWAVEELQAIEKALDGKGEFPRSTVGDALQSLVDAATTTTAALRQARGELAEAQRGRLDATAVALASLRTRATKSLTRIRHTLESTR